MYLVKCSYLHDLHIWAKTLHWCCCLVIYYFIIVCLLMFCVFSCALLMYTQQN